MTRAISTIPRLPEQKQGGSASHARNLRMPYVRRRPVRPGYPLANQRDRSSRLHIQEIRSRFSILLARAAERPAPYAADRSPEAPPDKKAPHSRDTSSFPPREIVLLLSFRHDATSRPQDFAAPAQQSKAAVVSRAPTASPRFPRRSRLARSRSKLPPRVAPMAPDFLPMFPSATAKRVGWCSTWSITHKGQRSRHRKKNWRWTTSASSASALGLYSTGSTRWPTCLSSASAARSSPRGRSIST